MAGGLLDTKERRMILENGYDIVILDYGKDTILLTLFAKYVRTNGMQSASMCIFSDEMGPILSILRSFCPPNFP